MDLPFNCKSKAALIDGRSILLSLPYVNLQVFMVKLRGLMAGSTTFPSILGYFWARSLTCEMNFAGTIPPIPGDRITSFALWKKGTPSWGSWKWNRRHILLTQLKLEMYVFPYIYTPMYIHVYIHNLLIYLLMHIHTNIIYMHTNIYTVYTGMVSFEGFAIHTFV